MPLRLQILWVPCPIRARPFYTGRTEAQRRDFLSSTRVLNFKGAFCPLTSSVPFYLTSVLIFSAWTRVIQLGVLPKLTASLGTNATAQRSLLAGVGERMGRLDGLGQQAAAVGADGLRRAAAGSRNPTLPWIPALPWFPHYLAILRRTMSPKCTPLPTLGKGAQKF